MIAVPTTKTAQALSVLPKLKTKRLDHGLQVKFGKHQFVFKCNPYEHAVGFADKQIAIIDEDNAYLVDHLFLPDDFRVTRVNLTNNEVLWSRIVTPTTNLMPDERYGWTELMGWAFFHHVWLRIDDSGRLIVFGVNNQAAFVERFSREGKKDI